MISKRAAFNAVLRAIMYVDGLKGLRHTAIALGAIMGDRPMPPATPFRKSIAANDCRFSAPFPTLLIGAVITLYSANL